MLKSVHHIAIICSDYEKSKAFYTQILGCEILAENYREERSSYKLDLMLNGVYCIELFSFPDPPKRVSRPEASGLRHLAFSVENMDQVIQELLGKGVLCEPVRVDEFTGKRYTFFEDPDGMPIELVEQ